MRALVLIVGALHLATGLFMAAAPEDFYDALGTFPPFNAHYVRDLSTFYLALGIALMVSAGRRSWQVPLLTLTLLQYALHVVNHVIDIGDPEPAWKGPATVVFLAGVAALLWWMLRRSQAHGAH